MKIFREVKAVTECCSYCGSEITMQWNVIKDGYKAFCPKCGERLMLCDECMQNGSNSCDYIHDTDSCKFNKKDEDGDLSGW